MATTHPSPLVEGTQGTCYLPRISIFWTVRGSNAELQDITNRLEDKARASGIKSSIENSKIMTSSTQNVHADISMNSQKLEEVTSFKYLGATLCKYATFSAEIRIRIASAMAAMARLNKIWQCYTISFASKFKPVSYTHLTLPTRRTV